MDARNEKLNIRELLEVAIKNSPDKIALIEDSIELTYIELISRVNQLVNYLNQLDLKDGTRVGLYSNKSYNQVIFNLSSFIY